MASAWKSTGHGTFKRIDRGVYLVRWRPAGKRGPYRKRKIAAESEHEIRDFLAREARNRSREKVGLPPSLAWKQCLELYADRLEAKGNTANHNKRILDSLEHFRQSSGMKEPGAARPLHVEAWLGSIAKHARKEGRKGWAATTNKYRGFLRTFYAYLVRSGLAPLNPVDPIEPFREEKRPKRDLSPEEYARVWKMCEPRARDLLDFLLLTGCRIGEAARMTFDDVDENGVWTIEHRKGRDFLRLPLPPVVLKIVQRQPRGPKGLVWRRWVRRVPGSSKGNGFVEGAPIAREWAREVIHQRCRLAKVKPFSPHDLRHAAATWAKADGQPIPLIQDTLGHATAAMTERYAGSKGGSKVVLESILKTRTKAIQSLKRK